MGFLEALDKLTVPPVRPAQSSGGTGKAQSPQGGSPGSPGSPAPERGGGAGLEALSGAASDADARRAWSVNLCRRLSEGVAAQSPPGLGRWEPAWEMVEAPSERLLSMLADWEQSGSVADQRAAIIAAEDVAFAWERAATAWAAPKQRKGAQ